MKYLIFSSKDIYLPKNLNCVKKWVGRNAVVEYWRLIPSGVYVLLKDN